MTYVDQTNPINDIFDQIYVHTEQNFYHFTQIWTNKVIFAPKWTQFWRFSLKMIYFDNIDPINDILDQIYVHRPDWNNFLETFREILVPLSPNFDLWRHFGIKNDPIPTIFT